MKKILLLGGSEQQIVAIETAKKLGFYTILCDYLVDNPGQYVADKFYLASTTDKELILKIAIEEKIDGIVAYASDPAAPTAAYVAEVLKLSGNPYESVEILCNKDKFRKFLSENKFSTPVSRGYEDEKKAIFDIQNNFYEFPIIIKPVDSSGSKGITVLYDKKDVKCAIDYAFKFSRAKRIIVEEFIENKHEYLVGGDIFIKDGKVVLWGLLNCHRDYEVNDLVPVGKSYPLKLNENDKDNIKGTLQNLVTLLGLKSGAMNVELIIDKNDTIRLIDVGPRNGGNMIPDLLGYIFNIDVVELTILSAMGMEYNIDITEKEDSFYATHNLHSEQSGYFAGVEFSQEINRYIFRKNIYKKKNDPVEYFDHAAKALGIIFMKFDTIEEMDYILNNINNHIHIKLKKEVI